MPLLVIIEYPTEKNLIWVQPQKLTPQKCQLTGSVHMALRCEARARKASVLNKVPFTMQYVRLLEGSSITNSTTNSAYQHQQPGDDRAHYAAGIPDEPHGRGRGGSDNIFGDGDALLSL